MTTFSQKMDELAALIKEEERFIYVKSRQDGRIRQALNK